jgi:hypothetical protein
MTVTDIRPRTRLTALAAALTYAGMGLRVLPGTVCRNGVLIDPRTSRETDEITVHPRTDATTDPDQIRHWWDVPAHLQPDVLGVADEVTSLVLVRNHRADTILASPWFTARPTPVVQPNRLTMLADFIVRAPFPADLAHPDVRPYPPGAAIRLPPSPAFTWLTSPWQTGQTLLTATELAELLTLTETTAP